MEEEKVFLERIEDLALEGREVALLTAIRTRLDVIWREQRFEEKHRGDNKAEPSGTPEVR